MSGIALDEISSNLQYFDPLYCLPPPCFGGVEQMVGNGRGKNSASGVDVLVGGLVVLVFKCTEELVDLVLDLLKEGPQILSPKILIF